MNDAPGSEEWRTAPSKGGKTHEENFDAEWFLSLLVKIICSLENILSFGFQDWKENIRCFFPPTLFNFSGHDWSTISAIHICVYMYIPVGIIMLAVGSLNNAFSLDLSFCLHSFLQVLWYLAIVFLCHIPSLLLWTACCISLWSPKPRSSTAITKIRASSFSKQRPTSAHNYVCS
jgi:hypothetical protein